jgi:hypothetical protein
MPILIRWSWQENTKSYLVIFYFYDDFSKPNLRFQDRKVTNYVDNPKQIFDYSIAEPQNKDDQEFSCEIAKPTNRHIMTWAPSHRELALLSDLLHYANMISGLSESIRRELRYDLEIMVPTGDNLFAMDEGTVDELDKKFPYPYFLVGRDKNKKGENVTFLCFELCSRYLEYLQGDSQTIFLTTMKSS